MLLGTTEIHFNRLLKVNRVEGYCLSFKDDSRVSYLKIVLCESRIEFFFMKCKNIFLRIMPIKYMIRNNKKIERYTVIKYARLITIQFVCVKREKGRENKIYLKF